jgi:hypothetical protein
VKCMDSIYECTVRLHKLYNNVFLSGCNGHPMGELCDPNCSTVE